MQTPKDKPFKAFDSFEEFFNQAEARSDYWAERAKLEFTREVLLKMNNDDISKGELASRLGVQPSMVTRLLSGRNNFELSTMVRIAMALNSRFRCHLEPAGSKTMWIEILDGGLESKETKSWDPLNFTNVEPLVSRIEQLPCEPVAA